MRLWRRPLPVTLPTEPGMTVVMKGREYVIVSITASRDGSMSVEYLDRKVWEERYVIKRPHSDLRR